MKIKYKNLFNIILWGYILFFLFVFFRYGYLESFPMKNVQPTNYRRWIEFVETNMTRGEERITNIGMYLQYTIYAVGFLAVVVQDDLFLKIKKFFKDKLNIIFIMLMIFLFVASRMWIYSLDYYKFYMTFVNSIIFTVVILYFINNKKLNKKKETDL